MHFVFDVGGRMCVVFDVMGGTLELSVLPNRSLVRHVDFDFDRLIGSCVLNLAPAGLSELTIAVRLHRSEMLHCTVRTRALENPRLTFSGPCVHMHQYLEFSTWKLKDSVDETVKVCRSFERHERTRVCHVSVWMVARLSCEVAVRSR